MMKRLFTALLVSISVVTFAQKVPDCNQARFEDALLDKMQGEWVMTGKLGEKDVVYNVSCKWVLNHQFLEWDFVNATNAIQYEAKVFIGYNCTDKRYVMHWMDMMGGKFSEALGYGIKVSGKEIDFKFKRPTDIDPNKYINQNNKISYNPDNDMWQFHVVMLNDKKQWVTWSMNTMARKR
ncbi:MAG: DUF1579 family protein [Bacteroidetes bacterium]|nr:DUF1579 family protein [Bacteroidota bacterium]